MCIATLLDVLGQKLAMEIIAYCVVDEAPRFLLGLSRLIFEYDIVVPPETRTDIVMRNAATHGYEAR
jgi:hypothetical protein